ncbi:MAG TPA: oligoendopeptidase F [Chlamydiales bacterium]|nr:oligoendopeptidase F [Chlamydiales bacterium]
MKARNELKIEDKWNVEALYPDAAAWNGEFDSLKEKAPQIFSYKGKLSDPITAVSFFEIYFRLHRQLEKLHTYAHLRMDEDLGNDDFKRDYGLISSFYHDFQHECAWIEPELLALSEPDFARLIAHPDLKLYQFFLEKVGRMRPHTLTNEQEELMALSGKALDAAAQAFSALNNADMTFQNAVDANGVEHPLSHGAYLAYMRSQDRELRKSAFQNLHNSFEAHVNTLCELIQGQVQSHLFQAKARKYASCLEAALFPHQIDAFVYENLIVGVRKALPIMHRYIALRKNLLGLSELHYYDLMVPLVEDVQISMSYSEAVQTVVRSVQLLGEEYKNEVKNGLMSDRWVDVYETPKKRSGAYSSGCYDSMPYILLNYQGTLNDVLTLSHETGHSMHSFLSRRSQPYIYSHYPIFVAEVASTFNEQLLLKELKSKARSKKELAYLLNYAIEGIRATIFRQTLFAEFEWQIHKWAEEGIPLTPSLLKEYYTQLNRDYYGPDLVLDKELEIEWARIPHFYYNFYVYQYATGLSAALSLFENAQKSDVLKKRYLEFLSSGGSRYPLDLLALAGVDMRSSVPIDAAMNYFSHLLDEFERVLSSMEKNIAH